MRVPQLSWEGCPYTPAPQEQPLHICRPDVIAEVRWSVVKCVTSRGLGTWEVEFKLDGP